MKKIFALLAVGLFILPFSQKAVAQSEIWAAGYVSLEFVDYVPDGDNSTCNDSTLYHVELKFYRDYIPGGADLATSKNVLIRNLDLNIPFSAIPVDLYDDGVVDQFCLVGNPVQTEYGWYKTTTPIKLPRNDSWEFFYAGQYRSDENNNIFPGQTFSVRTTLNNLPCEDTIVNPNNSNDKRVNPPPTSSPEFLRPHPVLSFCSGIDKRYNYEFPAIDPDNANGMVDNLSYGFTNVTDGLLKKVTYDPMFPSFREPFPSKDKINLKSNGVLSFTPEDIFTSATSIKITETRTWNRIENVQGQNRLVSSSIPISTIQIDYRIIFDDDCDPFLPDFVGVDSVYNNQSGQYNLISNYNSTEDAYEFDCGTTLMTFQLSNPMYCNTLDKNDFRIGYSYGGTDSIFTVIDRVTYPNCTPEGEFDQITIELHDPIGPGEYNIFFRYGSNDSTTILNRCDFDLPIDSPWVKLYVNNNYTYEHPYTDTVYCDPANINKKLGHKGIKVPTGFITGNSYGYGKAFFTWRQNPLDPNSKIDTILPGDSEYRVRGGARKSIYDVWVEDDNNPNTKVTDVIWQVGAGLDFSIYDPFTGDTILERICYDTDNFLLTKYNNPPVEVPDYDLCPDDDWPLVDLDSMRLKHNARTEDYSWEAFSEFPLDRNKADIADSNKWTVVEVGKTSLQLPGAMVNRYNFFISNVPLEIQGWTCIESDTFIVVKETVEANIGNDSTICPGEQYVLRNDYDYLVPDSMTYEWYYNDELVVGNDTDTMMIDKRGEYKLVVNKSTMVGTYCVGKDSVYINVADSLYSPESACQEVTFENGVVKQTFGWSVVEGADGYEARAIDMAGNEGPWEEANGEYGIYHDVNGAQMTLQSRPYNNEVPEDAVCRYGPVSNIAQACEVIIKPTNVFTPNGDGVNDYLAFDLLELYPGSKLQVFNRWGKLIYEDDSYYNDWDGEDYPAGTYFYVLDINDESYGIFKGSFTIIRD